MGTETRLLLVVDMQTVVAPGGAWAIPGVESTIDAVVRLVERHQGPILASRHRPVPDKGGTARRFGPRAARDQSGNDGSQLVPPLAHLPAVDKNTYSVHRAQAVRDAVRNAGQVVLCGVETDCCVLATVFDLLDDGIPTIVVSDAVTGPDHAAHVGALRAMERLGELVELCTVDELGG